MVKVTVYSIKKSIQQNKGLSRLLPGGVHHSYLHRSNLYNIHIKEAYNNRVIDIDGNEYVDLFAKSGAMLLGHSNQMFNKALTDRIEKGFAFDLSDEEFTACALVEKYVPCCEMVRFGLSGSEMIHNAIRLSRHYTGRMNFIVFEGHFHGTAYEMMDYDSHRIIVQWQNLQVLENVIRKKSVAAIIMEPICMNGGGIVPAIRYMEEVRRLCDENNVLLIFDEIITGVRTGLGGMQARYQVIPDLCVMGKSLGNGIPISMLCGKKKIMSMYEKHEVIHGGTHNGYALGLAALCAVYHILEINEHSCQQEQRNQQLCDMFTKLARQEGVPLVIQGANGCYSLNVSNRCLQDSSEFTRELARKNTILRECMQVYGILLAPTCRMYPSIILDENDLDFIESRCKLGFRDAKVILKHM